MSTTSKSPRKVLQVALVVARKALPAYAHRFSPKKFTQHQLFACLVLKEFLVVTVSRTTLTMPLLRQIQARETCDLIMPHPRQ